MQNIWIGISNIGVKPGMRSEERRSVTLSNQLNFVMLVTMALLLLITIPLMELTHDPLSYGTLRVVFMLIFNVLNMGVAFAGMARLSKLLLIFIPPVIFLLGPTIYGYVEEESYTYYPYVVICVSIIPLLLLHPKNEKYFFWLSITYYFLLTVFIDKLMDIFSAVHFPIVDRINTFYAFYKIAQILLFLFVSASIYYLRMLSIRFESELSSKNAELDLQNAELVLQKNEISRQKDELVRKETSTWQKLVSIISHEIVNSAIPITNLAAMSSQMLEDESGKVAKPSGIGEEVISDIHTGLKIIESRTAALINLVRSTRSLTRIQRPTVRRVKISELMERISMLYLARFRDQGISFSYKIDPAELEIMADLELIEEVLINLIQNSIEAMAEIDEKRIGIEARSDGSGNIRISVTDNGKGISEQMIEQIFLPFFSTKPEKSGIGLSLAQQVMLLHNGRIEVSSAPGGGASFTMVF